MSTDKSRFVVSADWVEQQLGTPNFRIVDASWYLPAHKRDGKQEYASGIFQAPCSSIRTQLPIMTRGFPIRCPPRNFSPRRSVNLESANPTRS